MKIDNVFYLPSGRIFLLDNKGYKIECTEMRDVSINGKLHEEVRTSNDPHVIWKHLVDYKEKWLMTVSTQMGCTHQCTFCDVAKLPFNGNLSQEEIENQIICLIKMTPYVKQCDKLKIGFARMGEPGHNLDAVIETIERLPIISESLDRDFKWLPCFNTILPRKTSEGLNATDIIDTVLWVKESKYNGFLHFQISCNSTDEAKRRELFGGANVFTIEEMIAYFSKQKISNRTITLNFIVMDGVEVDVQKLKKMGLNKDKFMVKLIPLNETIEAKKNNLKTYANYNNYEKLLSLRDEFKKEGIPTVVDAIAKCEEASLCCGQLAYIHM